MMIASKQNIRIALLAYGEAEIAAKLNPLTDEQILTIADMSMKFIADTSLIDKMLALAAVEFFEGKKRNLKKNRRDMSYYKNFVEEDPGFFGRALDIKNRRDQK